jgi:hypothetical protein
MKKIALLAVLAAAGTASAAEISYNGAFSLARTNWSDSLVIPKFDPALGTLISVRWTVSGNIEGSAAFESLDASDTTIMTALSATISLTRPDASPLQVIIPVAMNMDLASAFDGTIDFGGTSGKSYPTLSASDSGNSSTNAAADLALFSAGFIGETIALPVTAVGSSTASGAGNRMSAFTRPPLRNTGKLACHASRSWNFRYETKRTSHWRCAQVTFTSDASATISSHPCVLIRISKCSS